MFGKLAFYNIVLGRRGEEGRWRMRADLLTGRMSLGRMGGASLKPCDSWVHRGTKLRSSFPELPSW
jgi:hypothetical protein